MLRRLLNLIKTIGLPVLVGQFLFDWFSSDLTSALGHLPLRAGLLLAVLLAWAAFREHRERKKRIFR